jgi:hypothetical protein
MVNNLGQDLRVAEIPLALYAFREVEAELPLSVQILSHALEDLLTHPFAHYGRQGGGFLLPVIVFFSGESSWPRPRPRPRPRRWRWYRRWQSRHLILLTLVTQKTLHLPSGKRG